MSRVIVPRGYSRSRLVVTLRDELGLSWQAIALAVYGRKDKKLQLQAYGLYVSAKKRQSYRQGNSEAIDTQEYRPERGWQSRAAPTLTGSTVGSLPSKWGKKGEDRYLEEAAEILRYFYDLVLARYDFDKSILAYAEELLRRNKDLLAGEKVHAKRNYVKLTPRVAAVIYACYFAGIYNLARAQSALQDLFYHLAQYLSQTSPYRGSLEKARRDLRAELEKVMPRFVRYLVPP